jgi:glycosyltransferase involved in cell wall biosynthesis
VKNPLVSVVLPTHNRAAFLERAIRSVVAQTETNLEIIVVDDASSDGTPELLNRLLGNDPRVRILRNLKSLGGGGARNVGIAAATGEWVAFIDDDDEWAANKLECQLEMLREHASAVACSCDFEQQFSSGATKTIRLPKNVTLNQLLQGSVMGGASMCLCSREVLRQIGGFDTRFKSGQDWDLWTRLRQEGDIVACSEVLVRYQAHDGPRISNNMHSQYQGARHFYFKHRSKMDLMTRRLRIAYGCFIMSRQISRSLSARLKYLILSLRHSNFLTGVSYSASSAPRLMVDFLSKLFKKKRFGCK